MVNRNNMRNRNMLRRGHRKAGMTRAEWLQKTGLAAAGLGAAGLGLGTTARAQTPTTLVPDTAGSLIGAVRMDAEKSYGGLPESERSLQRIPGELELDYLLRFSDDQLWELSAFNLLHLHVFSLRSGTERPAVWEALKERIDYTYNNIHHALKPLLLSGNPDLKNSIINQISGGKRLVFKANIFMPSFMNAFTGDGSTDYGYYHTLTDWVFLAAVMRWFHDKLEIKYGQMALAEAGSFVDTVAAIMENAIGLPNGTLTPHSFFEGLPLASIGVEGFFGGYPFYFVRQYLAESAGYQSLPDPMNPDNPMNGLEESLFNIYLTPAQAAGKLMVYDLNKGEHGRSCEVTFDGDNYDSIYLHKVLVGDGTTEYPGCVLVNVPKTKVHNFAGITNAIKNLGIGAWTMNKGYDEDPSTPDWLYSFPPKSLPTVKGGAPGFLHYCGRTGNPSCDTWHGGGVYHDRYPVEEADPETGIPLAIRQTPNQGLDGTMVDINLALKQEIPSILHVCDAIMTANVNHGGPGVLVPEGFVLASEDPVALDLLAARYMYKNVPMNVDPDFGRESWRPTLTLSGISGVKIIEHPLEQIKSFEYAESRNLGEQTYFVSGKDMKSGGNSSLISQDGHLGKIERGCFSDIMTKEIYFHELGFLYSMQPMTLGLAKATDDLTGMSFFFPRFGEMNEDGSGYEEDGVFWPTLDYGESGPGLGANDAGLGVVSFLFEYVAEDAGDFRRGTYYMYANWIRLSHAGWNEHNIEPLKHIMDSNSARVAYDMAFVPEVPFETMDPFFGIPFGIGADGIPKWPSFYFAKYVLETFYLYGRDPMNPANAAPDSLYGIAKSLSEQFGLPFTLYVPSSPWYFPYAPYSYGHPGVEVTMEPSLMFRAVVGENTPYEFWLGGAPAEEE
jgi:hypothetical protein